MAQWIGCMVSINCGDGDSYQGEIVDATGSSLTLIKAFCNGIPCDTLEVVLRAQDIINLKLIHKQHSPTGRSTVTVAKPTTVKHLGKTTNTTGGLVYEPNRSKPIDIEIKQNLNDMWVNRNSTPSKKDRMKNRSRGWKDEACFGSPIDQAFNKDFDFEKNLALFDKQALWDKLNNSQRPDIVKQTDQCRRAQTSKYRHDENVLTTAPIMYRQITMPKQELREYVTDEGLVIPCISPPLRNRLWEAAERLGLTMERRTELMGRAACEMALQLLGGGHRLNPHNSHQCPTVVVLCGPHKQGIMGLNSARQLTTHGVNTIVYAVSSEIPGFKEDLQLYLLTKNKLVTSVKALPQMADLIILALCDGSDSPKFYNDLATWTNGNRAPVLALDPPAVGSPGISTKYSLVPVLPLAHSSDNGKIYLCNLGFPVEIFEDVGIKYKSPFGSKFVIPLHPNEDC